MAQDIKQKITLEGEKEYNAALRDAQRHLKTLRSELKAETAELGKNASAADKNKVKSENLRKSIKEQEKVVKTLKTALDAAKKEYGDNEEVVAKWENKLNEARATLANMKNDLDTVTDGIKEINGAAAAGVTATRSFAESIESIGNAGGNIASAIENTFTGVIDVVRDAVSELWALVADTAAKANEWTDIAAIWNTDPAKIEKYARGVEYAGKSFSDLQAAVSKIATGDADKIRELTGVSWVGDIDEWQYAMDVLSAISGMEYSKKLETLSQIFGDKRAAGIMDIVNAWSTILEGGDKLTSGGYGLGEESIERMNEIQELINKLDASWKAFKDKVAGIIGKATIPIMMDVQGGLDGIAEYLNATDDAGRQAALDKITENITQFCTDVAAAIEAGLEIIGQVGENLQGSDSVIAQAIGNALVELKKTLEWLMDDNHWSTIKSALETFFGLWLTGKALAAMGKITSLAANIKTITAFNTLNTLKGLFSGGGAAAGGAAAGGGAAASAAGGGLIAGVSNWATRIAAGAAGMIGSLGNAVGPVADWFTHNTNTGRFLVGEGTWQDVKDYFVNKGDEIKRNFSTFGEDWDRLLGLSASQESGRAADAAMEEKKNAIVNKVAGAVLEEVEDVLLEDDTQMELSRNIINAAEAYWDEFRRSPFGSGANVDEAYTALQSLFRPDQAEDFDRLMGLIEELWTKKEDYPDLPSWWFSDPDNGGAEGLTSDDVSGFKGLPGQIMQAAKAGTAAGVSGIRVYMDGVAVGHLVAPTVSQDIAAAVYG